MDGIQLILFSASLKSISLTEVNSYNNQQTRASFNQRLMKAG
jgi:hypothetical protein